MPLESSEPQAAGQEAPERDQRTDVLGWPALEMVAWKAWSAPSSTAAGLGVSATATSLTMVTVAEACFAGSATLCAVIVALVSVGRIVGAV